MGLRGSPSTEVFAPTWGLLLRAIKKGWNCLTLMLLNAEEAAHGAGLR